MTRVTFITHDGEKHEIDAENGQSLMTAAIDNDVPGIDADCGGACACATCHVFVDSQWLNQVGEQGEMEQSMLEFAENVQDNSRLSCQIPISSALEGLTVKLPENQH